MSAWCFRELTSWADVYKKLGLSPEASSSLKQGNLTFQELKDYLEVMKQDLEFKLNQPLPQRANELSVVSAIKEIYNEESPKSESLPKTEVGIIVPEVLDKVSVDHSWRPKTYNADNDYGYKPLPNEQGFYLWYQKLAMTQIIDKINENKRGILLLAAGGLGKTFICAGVLRRLKENKYAEFDPATNLPRTFSHIQYLFITRETVVEQCKRVFESKGLDTIADVETINVETVRSRAGKLWIKESIRIVEGEEEITYTWKPNVQPCVVFFDEAQSAKNSTSKTHDIMCSYTKLPKNNTLVCVSATPFTRVSEAKCFAIATKRPIDHLPGFPKGALLNEDTWPSYASIIAAPSDPREYNEAALERLMRDLEDYVVRVKGVVPQFKAINKVEAIPFPNEEKRRFYMEAYQRLIEELEKLEKEFDEGRYKFVILLKFAMAAEFCHGEDIAIRMIDAVKRGKAGVCACKFKGTIIEVVQQLIKRGVKRDDIALIWGGGQTQLTKKQKAKQKIQNIGDALKKAGMDVNELLEMTDLDEVEDRELLNLPPELRLGAQSIEERQREIDKFQSGKTHYAIYTFKAGGVGLSLHHSDELTEFKCRRKESGYAVEEDIPNVPVRQRETFLAPTYSGIDMAQGLWRVPRITSLSDTIQTILLYQGTVEMDIFEILSKKLRCIGAVARSKENWMDSIIYKEKVKEHLNKTLPEDGETMEEDEGEEE